MANLEDLSPLLKEGQIIEHHCTVPAHNKLIGIKGVIKRSGEVLLIREDGHTMLTTSVLPPIVSDIVTSILSRYN